MVEKLKSILSQTHWSLLLKGFVFAAAWFLFPFWLFLLIALYLYFVPVPQSRTVAGPFLVLLLLTFLEPVSLLVALIFAAIFFYILLIKELILIDRKSAYEITILSLIFLLFLGFFERMGGSINLSSLFYSLAGAVIAGFLVREFIRFGVPSGREALARPVVLLSTVLMWQFLVVALFLPVDFVYQTVVAFLGAIFLIDLVPAHLFGESSREKVLATMSVIFVLFVFVLGSARWGL